VSGAKNGAEQAEIGWSGALSGRGRKQWIAGGRSRSAERGLHLQK